MRLVAALLACLPIGGERQQITVGSEDGQAFSTAQCSAPTDNGSGSSTGMRRDMLQDNRVHAVTEPRLPSERNAVPPEEYSLRRDAMIVATSPAIVTVMTPAGIVLHQNDRSKSYFGDCAATPAAQYDMLSLLFSCERVKYGRMMEDLRNAQVWKAVLRVPPSLVAFGPAGFGATTTTNDQQTATSHCQPARQADALHSRVCTETFHQSHMASGGLRSGTGAAIVQRPPSQPSPSPSPCPRPEDIQPEGSVGRLDDLLLTQTSPPQQQQPQHTLLCSDPAGASACSSPYMQGATMRTAALSSLMCRTAMTYDDDLSGSPRHGRLLSPAGAAMAAAGSPQRPNHNHLPNQQLNHNHQYGIGFNVGSRAFPAGPSRGLSVSAVPTQSQRASFSLAFNFCDRAMTTTTTGGLAATAPTGGFGAGAGRDGAMATLTSGVETSGEALRLGSTCGSFGMAFDPLATSTFATLATSPSLALAGPSSGAPCCFSSHPAPTVSSGTKRSSCVGGVGGGGTSGGGAACGGVASGGVASGGVASGGVASGGVASGSQGSIKVPSTAAVAASTATVTHTNATGTDGTRGSIGGGGGGGGGSVNDGGGGSASFRTTSCLLLRHAPDGLRAHSISARAAPRTGGSRALAFALSLNTSPLSVSVTESMQQSQHLQQQQRRQSTPATQEQAHPAPSPPPPPPWPPPPLPQPPPQQGQQQGQPQGISDFTDLSMVETSLYGNVDEASCPATERGSAPCIPRRPLAPSVFEHGRAPGPAAAAVAAVAAATVTIAAAAVAAATPSQPRALAPPGGLTHPRRTFLNPLRDGGTKALSLQSEPPDQSGYRARAGSTGGMQGPNAAAGGGGAAAAAGVVLPEELDGRQVAVIGAASRSVDAVPHPGRAMLAAACVEAAGAATAPAAAAAADSALRAGGSGDGREAMRTCGASVAVPTAALASSAGGAARPIATAASGAGAAAPTEAGATQERRQSHAGVGRDTSAGDAGDTGDADIDVISLSGMGVGPQCWHEVWATSARDPVTGDPVIVLTQMDVSGKVIAERHLALVMETEHRLVEQLFPRHILQYIAEEWTSTAAGAGGREAGGGGGGAGAGGGAAAIGGGGSDLASSWRPVVRDCNALATSHPEVTLLFADIRGFTPMCKEVEPQQVMALLNSLYSRYDAMLDEYGVYKVETIGDCYFVAGGLIHEDEDGMAAVRGGGGGGGGMDGGMHGEEEEEEEGDPLHAERVFGFAKAMLSAASEVLMPTSGSPVEIRIGLHTGPVVSGVVGTRMPRFCLFGDTVNTASRMESTGLPGAIHASEATFRRLPPSERDRWEPTGGIEVKGKGHMQTYVWRPAPCATPRP